MILVPASGALVTLLVRVGGATSTTVPIAAQGGAGWGDESAFLAFPTPGFGPVPQGLGAALSGVVRVSGQA